MAGMNVDGLISGLDTTSLINQLLQVEAAPQQALRNKVVAQQRVVTAYQTVNARFVALQTAAEALIGDTAWDPVKATSSTTSVVASVTAGAQTGSLGLYVDTVASAYSAMTSNAAADSTSAVLPTSFDLSAYGTTTTISSDGSLTDVAAKINAANVGVAAVVVRLSDTDYRLQLTGKTTGAGSTISLYDVGTTTPIANGFTQTSAAADASIRIGGTSDPATGVTVTQASNTFSGVMAGLTFTVTAPATAATLTVTSDADALANRMKDIVGAANATLDEIAKQTASDPTIGTSSPLTGDFAVRQLQQSILSLVSDPAGGKSLKSYGVQLTKDGHLSFDADAFKAAYAADPAATEAALTTGFVAPVQDLAKKTSAPITGSLTQMVQSATDGIDRLNDSIADWDVRLETRKSMLQRQFTALEVALGKMKDQSSWLAGQLASLPSWSQG